LKHGKLFSIDYFYFIGFFGFFLNSDWTTNAFKLKLTQYHQWFSPTMKFLLEGFVANIRQAMERAVEHDDEVK